METIQFYKVNDVYGEFSNFAKSPVLIECEIWPTVEHYFQASKFDNFKVRDHIKSLHSPMEAAQEGRNRNNKLKSNWDDVRDNVMYKGLTAKFLQHPPLKKLLLETDNAVIIEHTYNDTYWADGGDGTGKNMLGMQLMKLRKHLREISADPDLIFPPWISFPSTERYDVFWKMGLGEEYLFKWHSYVEKYGLGKYKIDYPEPGE